MYSVIIMQGGRQVDALLLSASPNRLRVVIPGSADTAEFQMVEGRWMSESGAQVELGAILSARTGDTGSLLGDARHQSLSAFI